MKKIIFVLAILSALLLIGCSTKTLTGNAIIGNKEKITTSELSSHDTESDCWVASRGKVYDITDFLSKHKTPLSKYCGTSEEFDSAYSGTHKYGKDDILSSFEIGVLE